MGRHTQTLVLSPWSGGLNSAQDPIVLGLTPNGQQLLSEADNIIFTTTGGRKKRGGQSHFNTTQMADASTAASLVDGIYGTVYWYNSSSNVKTEELVVLAEAGRMFYAPSFGSLTAITTTATSPTFSQGIITSEVMSEKLFLGYSKTLSPLVYSGGGAAPIAASASSLVVGTFPPGYILRQHVNRLFVAGDSLHPDRLYYSNTELPFAYGTSGGFIDINLGDGDPNGITAIFPPSNVSELYVAKRSKIFKIITTDPSPNNWPVIPVSRGIGCVQHNSVVAIDQSDVLFASDRGIHSLQQVITDTAVLPGKFLSAPIQTAYDESSNKRLISAIWAPDLNSYLFSLQREGNTTIETVYGFNVELGSWYRWTSVPANFLISRLNTTTESYEYYSCGDGSGSTTKGYINKLQQSNLWDFSSQTGNIVTTVSTGLLYADGNFLLERNFVNIILLVRSRDESPIQVSYQIDEVTNGAGIINQRIIGANILGSSTYLLGTTFILGAPTGAKPLFMHTAGVGNAIQVTIVHDTIDADLEVYGLAVEFESAEESQNAYRTFPSN